MSDREPAPPRQSKPFRLPPAAHRVQADIDREFQFHIEERIDGLVAQGLSREQAAAEIRRKFGDYQHYSDETRDIDVGGVRSRTRQERLHNVWRNMRLAGRTLARTPGFTALAILTLSLGIGATVAIFSVLDSVVLRPLPFARPEQLVAVKHPAMVPGSGASNWGLSVAGYHHIRKEATTLADLGAFVTFDATIVQNGDAARIPAASVTATLINLLGFGTALGRNIIAADDRPGAENVAVLSHEAWQSRFGADPTVIDKTVDLGGFSYRIIGVMRPGAVLPFLSAGGGTSSSGGAMHRVDIWLPFKLDPNAPAYNAHYLLAVAGVKPNVPLATVQSELERIVGRFPEVFPSAYSRTFIREYQFGVTASPLRRDMLGSTERVLWLLLGAVALVFAIAATNVANLFLVRAEVRRRETGIRSALGAGRGQLALLYVSESLVLTLLATGLGLFVASVGVQSLIALAPAGMPRLDEVSVGWRSIVIALALGTGCGVLFGLFPLGRDSNVGALRDGGRGATVSRARRRVRSAMVVGQVSLALVLLAGAGVMVRSVLQLFAVRPGFDATGVLAIDLPLSRARYRTYDNVAQFHRALLERVSALPGVTSAGLGTDLPLDGMGGCSVVYGEGRVYDAKVEPPCVTTTLSSPGYFATLGMPVRGRAPTWADLDAQTGAVVVTRALAERLWPGEDPLGKGIRSNGPTPPYYRVVGVVDDLRGTRLEQPPTEVVFYPMKPIPGASLWEPPNAASLIVRSDLADPSSLTASIRRVVSELDPSVPVANVRTMDSVVRGSTARSAFIMALLSVAAAMAVILSAVGLYAVISYVVAQRRSEIGLRMALGARVGQVSKLVMIESLQLACIGVFVGISASLLVNRMLSTLLFEVRPTDPLTLAGVSALLIGIALLATLVPARRASHVDPIEVLREG